MANTVKLITLTPEQIASAKQTHSSRKQITHAVVCEGYGQLFGTETHCTPFYKAWSEVFPYIFTGGVELEEYDFEHYETTPDLLDSIYEIHDPLERDNNLRKIKQRQKKLPANKKVSGKQGLLSKIFRR